MDELPTFDGWRAVAILAVAADHFSLGGAPTVLNSMLGYGSRGVDLFFAISGFLICNRLLSEERRHGGVSIRAFYIRRIFRILPVFLAYLAFLACVVSVHWHAWIAALFFYRNYIPPEADWDTRHFWSLAVEEHFYLMMPFLFVVAKPRRIRAFLSVAVLLALWTVVASRLFPIADSEMRVRTDYRMPALLLGCAAALAFADYRRSLERIPKPELVVPVLGFLFVAAELIPKPERFAFQAPLFPIMLLSTTMHAASPFSRFLQLRPMVLVGKVSYGVYVWQQFFLSPEQNALAIRRFPLNFVLLIAVVVLSFRWMESPLMRVARRLSAQYVHRTG